MNLKNTLQVDHSCSIRASVNAREQSQAKVAPESSVPIEDVLSALEETVIRLQSNPSYGLKGVIADAKFRHHDCGLICELDLALGRMVVCVSNSKKKLRRLMRRFGRNGRVLAQGLIAQVGSEMAQFRTQLANCIHAAYHAFVQRPDPEDERRKRKIREKRARFSVPRNFQPQFA